MLNTFEMNGKRYIILSDDNIQLFDNWLVGQNLRLAEEQKRLTKRAVDVAYCTVENNPFTEDGVCLQCGLPVQPHH